MKTLVSNNTVINDMEFVNATQEAYNILLSDADETTDFELCDGKITEYDLTEESESVEWSVDSVSINEDGTISHIHLDC